MLTVFTQQTTPTDNRGQSDPYVSFLLRQATQQATQKITTSISAVGYK